MATSDNTLTMRQQERKVLQQRIEKTACQIEDMLTRLLEGIGNMTPSEWDSLMAEYHTALRRKETDEDRLKLINSKAKLTDEERSRTQTKVYKNKYKY